MRKIIEPSLYSWNIGDVRCSLLSVQHELKRGGLTRAQRWGTTEMAENEHVDLHASSPPFNHRAVFISLSAWRCCCHSATLHKPTVYWISKPTFHLITYFLKSWCVAGSSLCTPVPTSLSWCYQIQLLASQPAGNSAKFQVFECCVGQSATLYSTCDIMSEACIWRQKQNASAMWLSGHTDVSEGVSPYTLAVVCPCRSAEPRSHSCWSGWLWSSASPGPAADWDTNTAQRLLANAQWNPHVSYNTRCSHGFGCCCSEWLKRTYSLRCGIEVRRLVFWTILAWFLRLIWMTDGASLQGSPST